MSLIITLARCAVVVGYTGLSVWLTAGEVTELRLWILTVVGAFCLAYILAADWIAKAVHHD